MKSGKSGVRLIIPLLIILLGAWLRFHALVQDHRFHPDEALFSTFARAAAVNGDWMLPGALDKTPLAIYANALSQVFVGEGEFAARLPGTLASILLIPVMGALARQGFKSYSRPSAEGSNPQLIQIKSTKGTRNKSSNRSNNPFSGFVFRQPGISMPGVATSLFAMLLTALSPFAIAFSATAFTDGMMLMFMTLALRLIVAGRWGWSGFALALAFACKQQALFYVPLVLALGILSIDIRARYIVPLQNRIGRFILIFVLGIGALLMWDSARGETSIFALAAVNNDPWRLIRANEILPRLTEWLDNAQMLLAVGWMTLTLIIVALAVLVIRVIRRPRHRAIVIDLILFTFILSYGLVHWLIAFNTYDRYMLPILPPLILLVARGIGSVIWVVESQIAQIGRRGMMQHAHLLIPIFLTAILLIPAINASEGRTTINDEYHQYEGIDELAAYLNSKPVATVIYDRWLGWELAYYMGQWTDKRRVYYPTPDELARGALALCEIGPRYLPAPVHQPINPYLEALREAGFGVTQVYDTPEFVVYEIMVGVDASSAESSSPDRLESCGDESP